MGIELVKDLLKMEDLIGENNVQAIIEGDILAPDTKPDIMVVTAVDGDIQVRDVEIREDQIFVGGSLKFKVLYTSQQGEDPLYTIDSSTDFKQDIQILGLSPGMKAEIAAEIEHIDYTLNNERKIGIRAIINFRAKAIEERTIEITRDVVEAEDIELLTENFQYTDIIATRACEILVRDAIELGDTGLEIREVLKCTSVVLENESKLTDGKVIVGGNLLLEILYLAEEDNSLNTVKAQIPFTHFVEIPQVYDGMDYTIRMGVEGLDSTIRENINGENKVIEVESNIKIDVAVMETRDVDLIVDAYSPSRQLNLHKNEISIRKSLKIPPSQVLLKENIDIYNNPPIDQVISLTIKPIVMNYNFFEGKIIIEGVLAASMIYISRDGIQPINNYMGDIPFRHHLEMEDRGKPVELDIKLLVQDLDYSKINEEQVEVRVNLASICEANSIGLMNIVSHIEEAEEELDISKRPSLTIYFFQEGDSLWKIAKKYKTRVENIILSNNIEDMEDIKVGDQILIEKIYDFKF